MSDRTRRIGLGGEPRAPWGADPSASRGRLHAEPTSPTRTPYQRDRDRIVHSTAFRRLAHKTQVFLPHEGDHFRSRLTHTIEVAQIARALARAFRLDEDLAEALALGHDLGHTPFGHAGERVLARELPGGFLHYEQSLRVVDRLERRGAGRGLNLTWEVRDGILRHSAGKMIVYGEKPKDGPATREGLVISVADMIGYLNHDVDDAIRAGVLDLSELPGAAIATLGPTTSARIDRMVVGVIEGSQNGEIGVVPDVAEAMVELRNYMYASVYPSDLIDAEIRKAEHMLHELYHYLLEHPADDILDGDPEDSPERRTADFVAGMTDEYAMQLYRELVLPRPWRG